MITLHTISFSLRRCPADSEKSIGLFTIFENMDTSSPSIFVNGESLPLYFGKRVRAVVQVIQSDGAGTTTKSTDEHQLIIKGLPVIPPLNFVEVIGIADSNQRCFIQSIVQACKWRIQSFISLGSCNVPNY
ncbi:hypothetical protein SADUNF_Sadunf10G0186400 [Salix dunnii]|uniref:Uncharacterized protein n=1 Tax=Salix dunnii TaxID=1413687 RepID=A0A835JUV3_9ROSI|nr:hypothetical protein SADUNF_Sadunf10G0186400 [Salix dunnii]